MTFGPRGHDKGARLQRAVSVTIFPNSARGNRRSGEVFEVGSAILVTIAGLFLLIAGAELLVRGASRAAELLRAPSMIVGLTLVAWGTSAPELAVSVRASVAEQPAVALANVIGSNIFNVLFVLGLGALIVPLAVHRGFIKADIPVLLAVSLLAWFLMLNGALGTVEAAILLIGIVTYTYVLILRARRTRTIDDLIREKKPEPVIAAAVTVTAVSIAAGLAALVFGARWFVDGAVEIAMWAGVSERVIGLSLVAAGTSLPEAAATVVAGVRGERELAVGNVIGSNLFNLLAILGVTVAAGGGLAVDSRVLTAELPVMVGAAALVFPLALSGLRIGRVEGAVLVALFAGYLAWLLAGPYAPGSAGAWLPWLFLAGSVLFAVGSVIHGIARRKQ
ncbi:MAG: Inner membrane protein YrbG [Calditrichaeota bacterium]|nr:Inner membrane protein YrbG [Calditrichota bacterium]